MSDQLPDDWTIPTTVGATTVDTQSYVTEGMDFKVLDVSISPRYDAIGMDSGKAATEVCVTMKAKDIPDDEDSRAPVDIVVALDISGSMRGNKLDLCKRTLELLLRQLHSKDRFALIVYGSAAKISIPASFTTPKMKEGAAATIKSLCVDGSTNLSAGIALAAQEMNSIHNPNQVRSIFLLTDGYANQGVTSTDGIVSIVKSFNPTAPQPPAEAFQDLDLETSLVDVVEQPDDASMDTKPRSITVTTAPPISLHCFGYGTDHKSDMLKEISSSSPGGTYYFVENDSDVSSAFGDAMGGILSVVAQSAVLSIGVPLAAAARDVSIVKVFHEEAIQRENGTYTVTVGDFYAEETRDVLFEITLAGGSAGPSPVPHVVVSLSYTDTIQKNACSTAPFVCAISRPPGPAISECNVHVETQWLRLHAANEMQTADREAQSNQLDAARSRLNSLMQTITASAPPIQAAPLTVNLMSDIRTVQAGFRSRSTYASAGHHTVQSKANYLRKQRCSEASVGTSNAYRTNKKGKMARKFGTV